MKNKILIPSLLLSLMMFAGSLSIQIFPATSAQGTLPTMAEVEAQIAQLTGEITSLQNERDALIRNAILNAGCLIGRENAGLNDRIVPYGEFVAVCPPDIDGHRSVEYQTLLAAVGSNNSILLEISGNITAFKDQLIAAYQLLSSIMAMAGSQGEDGGTSATTSTTSPTQPELSNADLALLAGFDPVSAPEIIEEYYSEPPQPFIELNGPNGPVKAVLNGQTILLAERVTLLPGEALEIPQMGMSIINLQDLTRSSSQSIVPFSFIPRVSAQELMSGLDGSVSKIFFPETVGEDGEPIGFIDDNESPHSIVVDKDKITIEIPGLYSFTVEWGNGNVGELVLEPGVATHPVTGKSFIFTPGQNLRGVPGTGTVGGSNVFRLPTESEGSQCDSILDDVDPASCAKACESSITSICTDCSPDSPKLGEPGSCNDEPLNDEQKRDFCNDSCGVGETLVLC